MSSSGQIALGLHARAPSHAGRRDLTAGLGLRALLVGAGVIAFLGSISRIGLAFIPETTNAAWGLAYLVLIAATALRPGFYLRAVATNAFLVLAAVLALLSALWSPTPSLSASRGILLILNILVGFMLFERLGLKRMVTIVFGYCALAQLLSLALLAIGHSSALDDNGIYKGLYLHRNALTMQAVLLYFTAILLFATGWYRAFSIAGAALALISVAITRSASGLVIIALVTGVLLVWASRRLGPRALMFLAAHALLASAAVVGCLALLDIDVVGAILNLLGKDATLTGRTILWHHAMTSFSERPWLGLGYFSFWNDPASPAPTIWYVLGARLQSFHNIYIDILVDIGALGLTLFVAGLLIVIRRAWRLYSAEAEPLDAWPFVYALFVAAYGFSEYPIFWNNEFQMLLAFSAAAVSMEPRRCPAS